MTLTDIYRLLGGEGPATNEAEVTAITEDSRRVAPGTVFVAAPGVRSDGHDFVAQAAAEGAVAVIGGRQNVAMSHGLPYLYAEHPRRALGEIAHALAGHPSRNLRVIGVTGTNGKSSTIAMIAHMLRQGDRHPASFGTLGYEINGRAVEANHTTPFGEDLAVLFKEALQAGHDHVVMEVSSHALEQERVAGIEFHAALFTNLTQDHLDYHQTMESYLVAKRMLFERVTGQDAFTVVNSDDPSAPEFIAASSVPCHTFGRDADCRVEDVVLEIGRTTFTAHTPWGSEGMEMKLLGHHNISNALGAIAVCGALGLPMQTIAQGLASMPCVPGRFEHIEEGQDFQVIVDYAHTDDGLRNVLQAARALCANRIIVLFGCGGDRDKGKRPKMGTVAAQLGDFVIVTSDNPRTEDPQSIIDDIEPAVRSLKDDACLIIPDRAEAIRKALEMARPHDLVMLAGKGHEDYQIIGHEKIHFDDREVAREILKELP